MSDNPYLSLIQGLNSEDSPVNTAAPSPEDYAAELSLWTNAEFTFDMPPGLGIFETDSGFDQLAASNTLLTTRQDPVLGQHTSGQLPPPPSPQLERQPPPPPPQSLQFLDLSSQDTRPLSLLERTRQRNPLTEEPKPELQDQVAAINSFHSLLAAFSAATSQAQQQQQQSQSFAAIQPAIAPAPTAAPTTPAAAKVLRQSLPQYKSKTIKTVVPSIAPSPVSPTDNTADKIISSKNKNKDKGIEIAEEKKKKKDHPVSSADSTCKEEEEDDEVMAKAAAEEDKRRRNTAASARFRQKKKLREQTLEQTVREQTVRAEALEARIRELEMEARWLRGLLVEKDTRFMEATASLEEANKRVRLE
ncbi:hypothetical protein BGX34_007853 [Mortierella sp. NVP85]|nr:hypothetical protein BGX34_007853 [Mortierella sp. NVP85]